jgi:hypothetical protein
MSAAHKLPQSLGGVQWFEADHVAFVKRPENSLGEMDCRKPLRGRWTRHDGRRPLECSFWAVDRPIVIVARSVSEGSGYEGTAIQQLDAHSRTVI